MWRVTSSAKSGRHRLIRCSEQTTSTYRSRSENAIPEQHPVSNANSKIINLSSSPEYLNGCVYCVADVTALLALLYYCVCGLYLLLHCYCCCVVDSIVIYCIIAIYYLWYCVFIVI
jgi:hypothetical protein